MAQIAHMNSIFVHLVRTRKPNSLAASALRLGMEVAFDARRLTHKQTNHAFA